MSYVLTDHQYGKAENRMVRFYKDTPRHEIHDLNVSTALRGDFADAYLTGDQSKVLPTDTQKNTAFSYMKEKGIPSIEEYGLHLARHFVQDVEPVSGARVEIEEFLWERAIVDGAEHDFTWIRRGQEIRTSAITVDASGEYIVSGFKDLIILKSTGSEFAGFLVDGYTTLGETHDRVMATALDVKWRYGNIGDASGMDFSAIYASAKTVMVKEFATLQSRALQQTLWHMGTAVLDAHPEIVEIKLKAPNKHHFDYDIARFGVEQSSEVYHADDRPYGLIEATIARDDAPLAGDAWKSAAGTA
jgi:urate oxidase